MTSIERRGLERGLERGRAEGLREGLLEAIALGLKLRFGEEGSHCFSAFQFLADLALLRRIKQAIESGTTLDEIRQLLPRHES